MVATCLASIAGACQGATATLNSTRTREVSIAAAEQSVMPSRLWKVMRSPADTDEYGPSSMPRHQAITRSRSSPRAIWGSATPMSIGRAI